MRSKKHTPDTIKCPKCGAVVEDELSDVCEVCGADLDEPAGV